MSRKDKLLLTIRRNPKAVRFDEACKVAEIIGFVRMGGRGSHCTYGRPDKPLLLNFQNRNGYITPYQAKQLIKMMEKYGDET